MFSLSFKVKISRLLWMTKFYVFFLSLIFFSFIVLNAHPFIFFSLSS